MLPKLTLVTKSEKPVEFYQAIFTDVSKKLTNRLHEESLTILTSLTENANISMLQGTEAWALAIMKAEMIVANHEAGIEAVEIKDVQSKKISRYQLKTFLLFPLFGFLIGSFSVLVFNLFQKHRDLMQYK